jgi:hypothetical protein
MAKDLTAALHALTVEAQGQTTRQDKALPAVKEATAIPPRSGASGPVGTGAGGTGFQLNGEKTVASTDGLLTFYFPETLRATVGVTTVDVGVIVKTP